MIYLTQNTICANSGYNQAKDQTLFIPRLKSVQIISWSLIRTIKTTNHNSVLLNIQAITFETNGNRFASSCLLFCPLRLSRLVSMFKSPFSFLSNLHGCCRRKADKAIPSKKSLEFRIRFLFPSFLILNGAGYSANIRTRTHKSTHAGGSNTIQSIYSNSMDRTQISQT